jgi:heptosyltransferase-2
VLPTWLGDAVVAASVLDALRTSLPSSRIVALGPPPFADLYRGAPWVDAFVPYAKRTPDGGLAAGLRLAASLRRQRFDAALLLPNSFRAALVARAAGIPDVAGYSGGGRAFLLTRRLEPIREGRRRKPVPMAPHYFALLRLFGLSPRVRMPTLFVPEEEDADLVSWLRAQGVGPADVLVGLAPGASYGPSKLWLEERWIALGRAFGEERRRIVVLHGPGEEALARRIEEGIGPAALRATARPPSISFLKAACRRASLLVSTDSGPRHVAVAFRRPVVVLMGPNDPRLTNCFLDRTEVVRIDVDCGPCRRPICATDHRCMTGIDVERVFAAGRRWLARVPPRPALAPLDANR